jgi:hypothetical protein
MTIQPQTLITLGVLLLALVTVESGGYFLTKVVRGQAPANLLQKNFYRAGHAHAAVLLILSFAILSVIDSTSLSGPLAFIGRNFVPAAAILMPAGFFLSVLGKDPTKPNRLIWLLWAGVAALTIGLIVDGVTLIVAGATALGS